MPDVVVDVKKCLAYGVCVMTEPRIFTLPDDEDVASVIRQPIAPDEWQGVNDAMVQCPTGAISLESPQ